MNRLMISLAAGLLVLTGAARADDKGGDDADYNRQIFNSEICAVDGLGTAQCDCAFQFVSNKLSSSDLRLAMLLTASNSKDPDVAKKADQTLDKSNTSDKRRDSVSSEISALTIEAEDACEKKK